MPKSNKERNNKIINEHKLYEAQQLDAELHHKLAEERENFLKQFFAFLRSLKENKQIDFNAFTSRLKPEQGQKSKGMLDSLKELLKSEIQKLQDSLNTLSQAAQQTAQQIITQTIGANAPKAVSNQVKNTFNHNALSNMHQNFQQAIAHKAPHATHRVAPQVLNAARTAIQQALTPKPKPKGANPKDKLRNMMQDYFRNMYTYHVCKQANHHSLQAVSGDYITAFNSDRMKDHFTNFATNTLLSYYDFCVNIHDTQTINTIHSALEHGNDYSRIINSMLTRGLFKIAAPTQPSESSSDLDLDNDVRLT